MESLSGFIVLSLSSSDLGNANDQQCRAAMAVHDFKGKSDSDPVSSGSGAIPRSVGAPSGASSIN
jgi:hypothetical protein